jgi:TATA-binding protein-associated factor
MVAPSFRAVMLKAPPKSKKQVGSRYFFRHTMIKRPFAGARAMEALHRQVLPFLLRRLKENVLQDLPPKIIQDYYCELSPLQVNSLVAFSRPLTINGSFRVQIQLYEDFARSRARQNVEDSARTISDAKETKPTSHIFQVR